MLEVLFTKPDSKHLPTLNVNSMLIQYESNAMTLEYVRSFLPIWIIYSLGSNLAHMQINTCWQLLWVIVENLIRGYENIFYKFFNTIMNLPVLENLKKFTEKWYRLTSSVFENYVNTFEYILSKFLNSMNECRSQSFSDFFFE